MFGPDAPPECCYIIQSLVIKLCDLFSHYIVLTDETGAETVGSRYGAGSGADSVVSRNGAGSGADSLGSRIGAGSGVDSVGSRIGADSLGSRTGAGSGTTYRNSTNSRNVRCSSPLILHQLRGSSRALLKRSLRAASLYPKPSAAPLLTSVPC